MQHSVAVCWLGYEMGEVKFSSNPNAIMDLHDTRVKKM